MITALKQRPAYSVTSAPRHGPTVAAVAMGTVGMPASAPSFKAPCSVNPCLPLTEGDIADVVAHSSICVFQLQRRLPVAEEDLGGCVTGSAPFFELLPRGK